MISGGQPESSNAQAPRARFTARALLELRDLLRHLQAKAEQASFPAEGIRQQSGPAEAFDDADPGTRGTVHHG